MSQVQFQIAKFKFRQYQNTTFFRHFAKFNARQIFPLYGMFSSPSQTTIKALKKFHMWLVMGNAELSFVHAQNQYPLVAESISGYYRQVYR